MKLNEKAQSYYEQACELKLGEIERWFQTSLSEVEMLMAARGMNRGSIRNKALEDLIIERWRRLVDSRIESFLETYEQFEIKLEEDDLDGFVEKLNAARSNMIQSVVHRTGEGGASLQFTSNFDQIMRGAGLKLAVGMTKLNQKRKRIRRDGRMAKKNSTNVNVGSMVGSVIQTGKTNKANVSLSLSQFNETASQLRKHFEETDELRHRRTNGGT